MDNIILEFLQVYKSLDMLCKQILSSDRGVFLTASVKKYKNNKKNNGAEGVWGEWFQNTGAQRAGNIL